MLTTILAIAGKPGLFKLISGSKRMIIVESLIDGKRGPAYANEQVNALSDIAIYTEDEEVALREVFAAIQAKEGKEPIAIDVKKHRQTNCVAILHQYCLPLIATAYTTAISKKWFNGIIYC